MSMRTRRGPRSVWEQLAMESVEGPTVTVSLPREVAQQLVGMLMGSLELDAGADEVEGDPLEPDEDDFGGAPDGDADDQDPLAALGLGDDKGGGPEPDLDLDDPDDSDDSSDDDDEPDESMDYSRSGGSPSGLRTQTAFGESRRGRRR